ncbi:penicillin-binding protein 2 [Paenibacillus sp. J22TS3]|uniref:peptidoglycan D,D-transpeptidase FtsI family protein n=1 Tax=Paenibacillus sp. J22TS3 TaxID=2807192 RepID=UPI001B1381CA|nr:penicillin-binding transpeptidase domain-containing protein [Paenibacillus sp. J22TS3]GIP24015.1 penicillin-binding protein 2 [Paenibacillus sp. J22TS3]
MKFSEDRSSIEEEVTKKRQSHLRLNLFFFGSFIIFTVIILRLAVLQFVEGPKLVPGTEDPNVKNVPLPPIRGTIYDASREKLAYSTPVQSLYITLNAEYKFLPKAIKLGEELMAKFKELGDPTQEQQELKDIIYAMDILSMRSGGFEPRRIKAGLSKDEVAYFTENKSKYPGLYIVEESVRNYYNDSKSGVNGVAVQTVGYIKKFKGASTSLKVYKKIREKKNDDPALQYTELEDVGYDGLELQYQDVLRGKNGFRSVSVDPKNMAKGLEGITPPERGNDLYLNIHKDIQIAAQKAISEQLTWLHSHLVNGRTHPNARAGYAVAMEVDTGKVVAMASMPDYDPNVWRTGGITHDDFDKIKYIYQNGTIRSFRPSEAKNRLESVVYLGSTIKPLTVLIGLNEGYFGPYSTYYDKGYAEFGKDNTRIKNSSGHVLGAISPQEAIKESSNAFMIDMVGLKMYSSKGKDSIELWDRYMKRFGLGIPTGVDLPNEYEGGRDYYTNKKETTQSKMARAAFGQEGKYTTMQLAQYTAMLASKGRRMEPHIVDTIRDSSGKVIKKFEPKLLGKAEFSEAHWNVIHKGMATKVSSFEGFKYDFARKTGTSTQWAGKENVDNGVFIAFAPRNKPKLAIAVMIPEAGFGAQSAAPVARKIFDAYDSVYGLDGVPKGQMSQNADNSNVSKNTTR